MAVLLSDKTFFLLKLTIEINKYINNKHIFKIYMKHSDKIIN